MRITPEATNFLKSKANHKALFLELFSKGCSGYSFTLQPFNIINYDETQHAIKNIDGLWLYHYKDEQFLENLTIDLESNFLGETIVFKVEKAKSVCGCNKSFSI